MVLQVVLKRTPVQRLKTAEVAAMQLYLCRMLRAQMGQKLAAAGGTLVAVAALPPQPAVSGVVDRLAVNSCQVLEEVALVSGGEAAVVAGEDQRQDWLFILLMQRSELQLT
jgi:hypothetical protein